MTWTYQRTVELANQIVSQYDTPLTIRQIYYRLVANHGLPNTRSSYNGMDQKLTRAREVGDIDYTRIEDRHRQVLETNGFYEDSEDFYNSLKNYLSNFDYTLSVWNDQPVYVEVWVEKDALSRLIWDIAKEYQVTVCPSRGYGSFSYLKKAIDNLRALTNFDHLYIGGGNAKKIDFELDPDVTIVSNEAGIRGGVALWQD